MFLYVVSLLLSLFQFMFILCQKDNVAENLICGDSFLVRIVQVFVTVIHINGFKTNCDMYVSSKRMIHSVSSCFSVFVLPAYRYMKSFPP